MSYNCKNYTEQGGEKTVIGGTLEIKEGATVIGMPDGTAYTLPTAAAEALGGVKAAAKSEGDTVEVKVGTDDKLYVPAYPTVPEIPVAANQAASVETTYPTVTEFNTLLASLKTAGLMEADGD